MVLRLKFKFDMGSGSSEQQKHYDQQSEWIKYEAEISKDKPSQIQPFTAKQLAYLQQLFASLDKKNLKSLEIKDFEQVTYLRDHQFFPRIRELFEQEMKKTKAKRINFQLFLFLLSIFHVKTEPENKYKYLFRILDCDKNMKVDASDLNKIYRLIYRQPFLQDQDYSKLVTDSLIRFGNKGEIKLENLMQLVPEDEVKQCLSFRFNSKFV